METITNGKILILANNDVGLYKFRKELIVKLLERKNEVYISLPEGKLVEPLVDLGCKFIDTPIERRGMNPIQDLKLLLKYRKMIKEIKPTYVITYTIKPNIYGGIAGRVKGVPYAINITGLGTAFERDNIVLKIVVALYKIACKKAKVVFFENESIKEVFLDKKIIDASKAYVLNGAGVNVDEYTFADYPSERETTRFLFVGRIMKEKGVEELFKAAQMLKEQNVDMCVDIVGPYEEDYKEMIDRLQNNQIISYHGYQEDVKPFIQRCHCFVLPSYHEGMANTILEAGAMGRPLIVSDIPGCREAVKEGINGFLCEKANVESLCSKMREFVGVDYEAKEKMGKQAHDYIVNKFNRSDVVKITLDKLELEK